MALGLVADLDLTANDRVLFVDIIPSRRLDFGNSKPSTVDVWEKSWFRSRNRSNLRKHDAATPRLVEFGRGLTGHNLGNPQTMFHYFGFVPKEDYKDAANAVRDMVYKTWDNAPTSPPKQRPPEETSSCGPDSCVAGSCLAGRPACLSRHTAQPLHGGDKRT